ncbi:MAG: hypothetical protein QOH89_3699, partial [Pseudonocardiales bacterium]|nr:hypothetical protein [Pseudonocardiales bacterium]
RADAHNDKLQSVESTLCSEMTTVSAPVWSDRSAARMRNDSLPETAAP